MEATGRALVAGEILKYPQYTVESYAAVAAQTFGGDACAHRNFYWVTYHPASPHRPIVRLERGINSMLDVEGAHGLIRKPAVLLRTSASKAGTRTTPWHDVLDPEGGRLTYFGDMRPDLDVEDAAEAPGNRLLLAIAQAHASSSRQDRLSATPLLYFTAQEGEGRTKGHVRFEGLLHLEAVERVTQPGPGGGSFDNYRYDAVFVPLVDAALPWDRVAARWGPSLSLEETLALAPPAWRLWVDSGAFRSASQAPAPTPAASAYARPDDSALVDEAGMSAALDEVRLRFPGHVVSAMAHNNEGFDILVGSSDQPVRYVEVKSTRANEPIFIISETERRFSRTNADLHSLVVVTGIDLGADTHGRIYWYDGGVGVDQFQLKPMQWRGKGPI